MSRRSQSLGKETGQHSVDEPPVDESSASPSQLATVKQSAEESMATLDVILRKLGDFCQDNGKMLREIKDQITTTKKRIDEDEKRVTELEEGTQVLEDTLLELL